MLDLAQVSTSPKGWIFVQQIVLNWDSIRLTITRGFFVPPFSCTLNCSIDWLQARKPWKWTFVWCKQTAGKLADHRFAAQGVIWLDLDCGVQSEWFPRRPRIRNVNVTFANHIVSFCPNFQMQINHGMPSASSSSHMLSMRHHYWLDESTESINKLRVKLDEYRQSAHLVAQWTNKSAVVESYIVQPKAENNEFTSDSSLHCKTNPVPLPDSNYPSPAPE